MPRTSAAKSTSTALVLVGAPKSKATTRRAPRLATRANQIASVISSHPNPAWKGFLKDILTGKTANGEQYTPRAQAMHLSKFLTKHLPELVDAGEGRPIDALATRSKIVSRTGRGNVIGTITTGYTPTKLGEALYTNLKEQGFFRKTRGPRARKAA
jgi:hypothetical protein